MKKTNLLFWIIFLIIMILFTLSVSIRFFTHWNEGVFFGEVVKINERGFVINGRDNMEKTVIIDEETIFKKGRDMVKIFPQVGDKVTIVGSLDEVGQIKAKLIRIPR